MFTSSLKNMITDAREKPDEETYRVISRSIPSTRTSVPVKFECITLPKHGCNHQPDSYTLGFVQRLHHINMVNQLHFLSFFPLWRLEDGQKTPSFQSVLVSCGDQPHPRAHPESKGQKMLLVLLSLKNLQGCQQLYAKHGRQRPIRVLFQHLTKDNPSE